MSNQTQLSFRTNVRNLRSLAIFVVAFVSLAGFIFTATPAQAGACFCWTNPPTENQLTRLDNLGDFKSECTPLVLDSEACRQICDSGGYGGNYKIFEGGIDGATDDGFNQCQIARNQYEKDLEGLKESAGRVRAISSDFIPECLLTDELTAECRDIGIFVMLGINVARYLFTIVGALALLFFIYGGFILILSQGNSEKIQKGTGAIIAAIIGLAIVFAAYVLVNFLSELVGVRNDLKLF